MIFSKNKGFTLIELLVVIAVIGMLSSIILVSLSSAREKARDATRKQDLNTIQKALELYWAEHERYPTEALCLDSSVGSDGCSIPSPPSDYWHSSSDLQDLVAEEILGRIPIDPINNAIYYYWYEPDNVDQGSPPCQVNTCRWFLCSRLETTGGGTYCIKSVEQGL